MEEEGIQIEVKG